MNGGAFAAAVGAAAAFVANVCFWNTFKTAINKCQVEVHAGDRTLIFRREESGRLTSMFWLTIGSFLFMLYK
jgi:hypothetical protein